MYIFLLPDEICEKALEKYTVRWYISTFLSLRVPWGEKYRYIWPCILTTIVMRLRLQFQLRKMKCLWSFAEGPHSFWIFKKMGSTWTHHSWLLKGTGINPWSHWVLLIDTALCAQMMWTLCYKIPETYLLWRSMTMVIYNFLTVYTCSQKVLKSLRIASFLCIICPWDNSILKSLFWG